MCKEPTECCRRCRRRRCTLLGGDDHDDDDDVGGDVRPLLRLHFARVSTRWFAGHHPGPWPSRLTQTHTPTITYPYRK